MEKKKINKKKLIIILAIIILIIGIIIYITLINKETINHIFKYKDKLTIEAGSKIPTMNDYLYHNTTIEKEIVWDNIEIEEGKIYKPGTYKGKFNYDNEERHVTLIVKDTTPPSINNVKDIEVLAFTKVPNLLTQIEVSDNSKEEITPSLEGKYDIESPGEYTLTYKAKDSSGNEKSKEFKLIVKENKDITTTKSSKGYTIKNDRGVTYIGDTIIVNKTYSLPSSFAPNNLESINGYIKIVDFAKKAFDELKSDAKAAGLNIYASSGYRSYQDQEYIYNNYVRMDGQEAADTYSARAGFSEHQTGLVLDLNTVDISFDNTNESNWLRDNSYKYGFIIRYPKGKENITGYTYEPWHIRYVGKNLAKEIYNNGDYLTLEEYFGIDSNYQ